ncbi:MAG: glycosyltransferase family 39 protein [Thaumarchaeota archaeon]|nr:glycosyltransferase family 39 protein [Nitrososphaerota archaeon]
MLPWAPVKLTAILSLLLVTVLVALLTANVFGLGTAYLGLAQFVALGALASGLVALVLGLVQLERSRPELRRPLVVLGAITLAVLVLHLYIINSPPTSSDSSIEGGVNTSFHDAYIQVSSTLAGSQLTVSVSDSGSNAISQVVVSLNEEPLPTSGLFHTPTVSNPLEPVNASNYGYMSSVSGNWVVNAAPSASLRVDYTYLSCFHVPNPNGTRAAYGCIMDEVYYVPAALSILSSTRCPLPPMLDPCNYEHPPLAKALIAGGIAVFGLNDLGFRVSNAVLGTLSIPLVFVLAYVATGSRRLSYFATLILAADTLFFVHSSAALIDVPSVFFTLLACIFYFWRASWWKLNNYALAGAFFGLAALSKETAIFVLAGVATYELLFGGQGLGASAKRVATMAAVALLVFVGVVQLYDSTLASTVLPWFYQHISFMFTYGSTLKGLGWTDPFLHGYITPLNWLLAYAPVPYLVVRVTVTFAGTAMSYVSVGYYGIANEVIVWMVFLWVPLSFYRYVKGRAPETVLNKEDRFGLFLAVWFLWSYIPYIALWAYGRATYPFYILPAVPALAAGAAYFLTRDWFPRKVALVYVAAALIIFFLYFPVKDFLPVVVRALLTR